MKLFKIRRKSDGAFVTGEPRHPWSLRGRGKLWYSLRDVLDWIKHNQEYQFRPQARLPINDIEIVEYKARETTIHNLVE
jgi:hypothetical protein